MIIFNLFRATPSDISLNNLSLGIRLWPDHTLTERSIPWMFRNTMPLCPALRSVKSSSHTLYFLFPSYIECIINFIWFCPLKGFPIQSPLSASVPLVQIFVHSYPVHLGTSFHNIHIHIHIQNPLSRWNETISCWWYLAFFCITLPWLCITYRDHSTPLGKE